VELEERVRHELPHLPHATAKDLAALVERLVVAFRPERVYVYGSQARGDATPDSDVDLMVVVAASELPPHQRDQEARRVLGLHSVPLDVVVWTRDEFEARVPARASLPATVQREGRTLYAA
jgi:predicted nucleotidyltransferase